MSLISNWFLKSPDSEEIVEEIIISKNESDESLTIIEKVNEVKTDKFRNFLVQLDALKKVEALTTVARFQAAMATSQITLEDIKSNISSVIETISREKKSFEDREFNELNSKTSEIQLKIDEKAVEIQRLSSEIATLTQESEQLKTDLGDKLSEFHASIEPLLKDINSLEIEIKSNLEGKTV